MKKKTAYQPGNWFNSAKFFDIEYQTYGWVWNKPRPEEQTFYWEHEDGKMCLRLVYAKNDKRILGINVFGLRLRHETCDRWLSAGKPVEEVLAELADANFDTEFYQTHEPKIVDLFNKENGTNIRLKTRSWKRILQI